MTVLDPPRRARGCLDRGCFWGCLAMLAFLLLPVALAGLYGVWFLYQGFRYDPALRVVDELVRRDGMAHLALGDDIHIAGVEGNAFFLVPGLGSHGGYVLRLVGSKGRGTLEVETQTQHGQVRIDSMMLNGPNGGRYDLMHHVAVPGVPSSSI